MRRKIKFYFQLYANVCRRTHKIFQGKVFAKMKKSILFPLHLNNFARPQKKYLTGKYQLLWKYDTHTHTHTPSHKPESEWLCTHTYNICLYIIIHFSEYTCASVCCTCILIHSGSACTLISAHRLVCAALSPWPSAPWDPAYSLVCLHQGTGEVTTHQSAVGFWRISTRDVRGVEGHSQVLCHVGGFRLTGHVVPCQALLRVDLGLAHVIVSPGRRVMLHGKGHAGADGLQREQNVPEHRCSRSERSPREFFFFCFSLCGCRFVTGATRWLRVLLN